MFKRLFEKLFGSRKRQAPPSGESTPAPEPQTRGSRQASASAAASPEPVAEPLAAGAKERWEQEAARPFEMSGNTPEQLCGIAPRMTQDEIREQLAMLYRRHTRAESSPDANLRHEAAIMLDLIAGLQEKYLGSALSLPDPDEE